MKKIRVAVQAKGRLNRESIDLLREAGVPIDENSRRFVAKSDRFPLEVIYLRDDDISKAVEMGVVDLGIVGLNEVEEKKAEVDVVYKPGFGGCRLSLAIPKDEQYLGLQYFNNKVVATSYPSILNNFFKEQGISATLHTIAGSVEIAPSIGISDAVFDIVGSGETLIENGLKEVERVLESEALLIANRDLSTWKREQMELLISRFEAVKRSKGMKYMLFNIHNSKIEEASLIVPGMRSPTVFPLTREGWSSLHVVVSEREMWGKIEELKKIEAEGILIFSPEIIVP